MKVLLDPKQGEVAPLCATGVVTAIGFFDGAHLGHQRVFDQVKDLAAETDRCSAVVTFDPHPASLLRPENAPLLLTSHQHKLELFEQAGFDLAVVYSFSSELAEMSPAAFVERLLVEGLDVKNIVVGDDFHFGSGRSGDVDRLKELGEVHGFEVAPIELVVQSSEVSALVSSTNIRMALAGGDIAKANQLLGRPHEVRGTVVHGDKRGRTIGFPTANLELSANLALPADAVYAGEAELENGDIYIAAINVGKRPTFHQNAAVSSVEAHLLSFDGDLYGQKISVRFTNYVRSERRFSGPDELAAQLQLDIASVRELVG